MSALSISSISSTGRDGARERLPQLAALDVVRDVLDALVAELAVAQARDGVIFVEPLLGLDRRLDVPLDQRRAQRLRHFLRQHGLARSRLALDEQRALERDRGVHRNLQVIGCDVGLAARELHEASQVGEKSRGRLGARAGPGNRNRRPVGGGAPSASGRADHSAAAARSHQSSGGTRPSRAIGVTGKRC